MQSLIKSLILSSTLLSVSVLSVSAQVLTAEQVERDVSLARAAYQDIHPGYDRFTPAAEIDAAWQSLIDHAIGADGTETADLYLDISETLTKIRCDHTKAELPISIKASRKTDPVYLPLRWEIIEGRAIILKAPEDSGLNRGDEILSIDGRTISDLRNTLHKYIPVDGFNDHAKDMMMTASLEHMGGAVDHFGALLFETPATAKFMIETPSGERSEVRLERVNFENWKSVAIKPGARNLKDAVTFDRIGDDAAYLSISTFVNYREPVDAEKLYAPVFEALEEERRTKLILDLRENGGGSTDASQALFARFIPEKRKMKRASIFKTLDHDAYTDYISTWDKRAINPNPLGFKKTESGEYSLRPIFSEDIRTIKPAKVTFDGELIILTSRGNSSGATNFMSTIKAARPVTLVGEKTGGNPQGPTAGSIFFLKLPESKMTLRLPVIRFENNVGDLPLGEGLTPDVLAPTTVVSVRAGRDPAMEAALKIIGEMNAGAQ